MFETAATKVNNLDGTLGGVTEKDVLDMYTVSNRDDLE